MTEQNSTHGIERIVFEPVRNGQWRMRLEGGDVEGHGFRVRFLSLEPAGEGDEGEQLYEIELGEEDVEGQASRVRF